LSSDHGIMPLPEHRTQVQDRPGGRVDKAEHRASRERAYDALDSLYGNHDFIHRKGSNYYYDFKMIDSISVNTAVVDSIMQTELESLEGIHRVYTKTELMSAEVSDPLAYRLSRLMHPVLSPDLYTLLEKGWIFFNLLETNHGTPYDYDSHVPLIFSNVNFDSKILSDSVATVDIAPTLGEILGVAPSNTVDGISLKSLIMTY